MQVGGLAVPESVVQAMKAGGGKLPGLGSVTRTPKVDADGFERHNAKRTITLGHAPPAARTDSGLSQRERRGPRFRQLETKDDEDSSLCSSFLTRECGVSGGNKRLVFI